MGLRACNVALDPDAVPRLAGADGRRHWAAASGRTDATLEGPGIFNAFSTGTFPIPSRIIPYPQFQQPLPFLLLVLITCV